MALSPSFVASSNVSSTSNTTTYTSGTFTTVAQSLMVIFVCTRGAATHTHTSVNTSAVGNASKKVAEFGTATAYTASLWSLEVATATSTTYTLTCTSATGAAIIPIFWTGYDQTLTELTAIVQTNTATVASNTSGSGTLPNANPAKPANMIGCFWDHGAQEATTPRTNWTEPFDDSTGFNTPANSAEAQVRTDGTYEQTYSASWTTSTNAIAIAYEVMAAGSLLVRRRPRQPSRRVTRW